MFSNIGSGELLIIALVIMVLFGSKKLPELARGLHEAVIEFNKGMKDDPDESKKSTDTNKRLPTTK